MNIFNYLKILFRKERCNISTCNYVYTIIHAGMEFIVYEKMNGVQLAIEINHTIC